MTRLATSSQRSPHDPDAMLAAIRSPSISWMLRAPSTHPRPRPSPRPRPRPNPSPSANGAPHPDQPSGPPPPASQQPASAQAGNANLPAQASQPQAPARRLAANPAPSVRLHPQAAHTVVFGCRFCGKSFAHVSWLERHERVHTGERPYVCSFPGCGKTFSRTDRVRAHEKVHSGGRKLWCEACGKAFGSASELARHKSSHCRGQRRALDNKDREEGDDQHEGQSEEE